MNIVSMAPITASQFGTNRLMQTMVLRKSENELTNVERFGAAAAAGAVSAFIASPSELIIIHQQVRVHMWFERDGSPGVLCHQHQTIAVTPLA